MLSSSAIVTGGLKFWFPVVLIVFWGWVRFATKYPAEAFLVVIFFAEECFDMFTFGARQRLLSDIGYALMLPLIVLNFNRVWSHLFRVRWNYGVYIILFFSVILFSLFCGSYLIFGQPMAFGLVAARKYLLFCSYFFLVAVGATREEGFRLLKYLAWLGALVSLLSIVDVALGGGVVFSHYYAVGQERAGQLRIHVGEFLTIVSAIYSLVKFQETSKGSFSRIFYAICFFLCLYNSIFIGMTRAVYGGIFITGIVWFLINKSYGKVMVFLFSVALLATVALTGVLDSVLSESFLSEIYKETVTEIDKNEGNVSIRKEGFQYFYSLWLDRAPITGVGVFSDTKFPNNPVTIASALRGYNYIDINGFTTILFFGVGGIVLLCCFLYKSLRDVVSIIRSPDFDGKYNYQVILLVFVYNLVTPTLNNMIVERMVVYTGLFLFLLHLGAGSEIKEGTSKQELNELGAPT